MEAPRILDRRRDALRGGGLLERGPELAAIDELLDSASEGTEPALLIVGAPGLGKTRLYGAALDRARARDMLVLRAAGSELEQSVAFGVAGQLLRGWLASVPNDERAALLQSAPERVRTLYGEGPLLDAAGAEDGLAVSHGLLVMLAAAAELRPVMLAIDDLHWCDSASLGFVRYLLHRLQELSVAMVLTSRPLGGHAAAELASIAVHPATRLLTLAPLGRESVNEMVGEVLGEERADALTDVCAQVTGGNPFYLQELLLALAEDPQASGEQLEEHARTLAPDHVTRSLGVRVGRLGADAGALARAVAVLGDEVPLRTAAALAEMDVTRASEAAAALASVNVLMDHEPLSFVHPLIRTAIEHDVPASQRATLHLQAARLLAAEGERAERVAPHLLRGRAQGDRWVVEQLQAAAAEASSNGAALAAVRCLERALAEPAPEELRAGLLAELGAAEAALGLEQAAEHLALAARASEDPVVRAEVALARGGALYAKACHQDAAEAYREGLAELTKAPPDPTAVELRDRLQTALVLSAATVPSLQPEARQISAEMLDHCPDEPLTQSQRLLLAQTTVEAAFGGRPAPVVVDLAMRAWDEARLLERVTPWGPAWTLITAALCLAGDLEGAIDVAAAVAEHAERKTMPLAFATATYMRALPRLWQGNVDGALDDLAFVREARSYGWRQYARSAAAQHCLCMIEKGRLDDLESVLEEDAPLAAPYEGEDAVRLYALAELRRAQGRFEEAHDVACAAGDVAEVAIPYLGYCPWRASAAESALAMGRRERAEELVAQELERLETTQVLHERIRALRLAGLCQGGEAGLSKLREAVELAESHPPRLEAIRALLAYGAALRRGKQQAASRPPLERAFDLARRGGATTLHEQARTELAASGARPRREELSGPGSLTASELRVAQLAAAGRSNREIAAALFVTPKTVEYHLRNCYRKLDIRTRRELGRVLGGRP